VAIEQYGVVWIDDQFGDPAVDDCFRPSQRLFFYLAANGCETAKNDLAQIARFGVETFDRWCAASDPRSGLQAVSCTLSPSSSIIF
jgi:hypothetical protein